MSKVALGKISSYDLLEKELDKLLSLINYNFDSDIKKVIIKPNMCYYWDYTTGQTTDPKFVGSIINFLRNRISNDLLFSIVESDASAMRCKHAFRMLGYEEIAKKHDVDLVNLTNEKKVRREIVLNGNEFKFNIPEILLNSDLKINIPKLKYMLPLQKISCGMKNIFGCIPEPNKYRYHNQLDEIIIGINQLLNFDLNILDGVIVSGIRPKKINFVMLSDDIVAFDSIAAKIASVNPDSVSLINYAHSNYLGNKNFINLGINYKLIEKEYPNIKLESYFLEFALKMIKILRLQKRMGLEWI
jgi:uncharacterized protein (DUF362 family)